MQSSYVEKFCCLFIYLFYENSPHLLYVQHWKFTLVIRKCIQYNAEGYKGLALTYTLLINKQHVKRLKLANSLTETVRQWKISRAHIHIIENKFVYTEKVCLFWRSDAVDTGTNRRTNWRKENWCYARMSLGVESHHVVGNAPMPSVEWLPVHSQGMSWWLPKLGHGNIFHQRGHLRSVSIFYLQMLRWNKIQFKTLAGSMCFPHWSADHDSWANLMRLLTIGVHVIGRFAGMNWCYRVDHRNVIINRAMLRSQVHMCRFEIFYFSLNDQIIRISGLITCPIDTHRNMFEQ